MIIFKMFTSCFNSYLFVSSNSFINNNKLDKLDIILKLGILLINLSYVFLNWKQSPLFSDLANKIKYA